MKTPFEILDINESASDSEIKSAYLKKVQRYVPDRFPEEFKKIKKAYDAISTSKKRIEFRLFKVVEPDMTTLITSTLRSGDKRIKPEDFYHILTQLAREEFKHLRL
jgi:curved DNA-binding protein CbpA